MAITISGSGIVEANIADNAVTLAKMASGTDGNIITYDTSGNPAVVATGSSGQILTSAGADAVPTFAAAAGIDCDADAWEHRLVASQTNSSNDTWDFGHSIHTGSNITEDDGIFTIGTAGWYLLSAYASNSDVNTTETYTYWRHESTTNIGRIYWRWVGDSASYGHRYYSTAQTLIYEFAAGETIEIWGRGSWYGGSGTSTQTGFTGVRLGA